MKDFIKNFWFIPVALLLGILAIYLYQGMLGVIVLPKEINLFGLVIIRFYSLSILSAVVVGTLAFYFLARNNPKLAKVDIAEGLIYVLIPGIIGARLYHVATDFYLYAQNLVAILFIWNGGLSIIGGIIGGLIGGGFYARQKKIDTLSLFGALAVILPLAQAVGRVGNLFNKELYGPPTNVAWGLNIEGVYYHPLFLYEAVANLILFGLLYWGYRKKISGFRLVAYYLAGYGFVRYILDFMRLDGYSGILGMSWTQWLILLLLTTSVIFGIGYQIWYYRKYHKWFTKHED